MGSFKRNPKRPVEVHIPNKIRKRITMHEKDADGLGLLEGLAIPAFLSDWKKII